MDKFYSDVAAAVAAIIIATVLIFLVKAIMRSRRRSVGAVDVSIARAVKWEWSIAFAGDIPPEAREIEGKEISARKVYDLLVAHGGVDIGATRLRLTVRGLCDETVIIRNIRVIAKKSMPLSGTLICCPNAGANESTVLAFNLEEPMPIAREFREDDESEKTEAFFDRNNVTLIQNEVHDFIIVGKTTKSLVNWRLYLDLEVGHNSQTIEIDDDGKPFKTTAYPTGGFANALEWAWYEDRRFQSVSK